MAAPRHPLYLDLTRFPVALSAQPRAMPGTAGPSETSRSAGRPLCTSSIADRGRLSSAYSGPPVSSFNTGQLEAPGRRRAAPASSARRPCACAADRAQGAPAIPRDGRTVGGPAEADSACAKLLANLITNHYHYCSFIIKLQESVMNRQPPGGSNRDAPSHAPARQERCLSSLELFQGASRVAIDHQGSRYLLQITRQGKLILTK